MKDYDNLGDCPRRREQFIVLYVSGPIFQLSQRSSVKPALICYVLFTPHRRLPVAIRQWRQFEHVTALLQRLAVFYFYSKIRTKLGGKVVGYPLS